MTIQTRTAAVGLVPAPQFDAEGNIANNLDRDAVDELKRWARRLGQ
jgi:hypothetical protein